MGKQQNSKKARSHRRAAVYQQMRRNSNHPSHIPARDWRRYSRAKPTDKTLFDVLNDPETYL